MAPTICRFAGRCQPHGDDDKLFALAIREEDPCIRAVWTRTIWYLGYGNGTACWAALMVPIRRRRKDIEMPCQKKARLRRSCWRVSNILMDWCTILSKPPRSFNTGVRCLGNRAQVRLRSASTGRWRTGWDSNPRYPCRYGCFRSSCLQPLGHLSWCVADDLNVSAPTPLFHSRSLYRRLRGKRRWYHGSDSNRHCSGFGSRCLLPVWATVAYVSCIPSCMLR